MNNKFEQFYNAMTLWLVVDNWVELQKSTVVVQRNSDGFRFWYTLPYESILLSQVRLTDIFKFLKKYLTGFKSGLWLSLSRAITESYLSLAVCLESLSYWKVNVQSRQSALDQAFIKGVIWCDFMFSFVFGVLEAVYAYIRSVKLQRLKSLKPKRYSL